MPFSLKGIPTVSKFIERPAEMLVIEEQLLPGQQMGVLDKENISIRQKTFFLHGLGGMGKTQLAVEFSRRHHSRYSAVLWLDGSVIDRLKQSFVNVARRLPPEELTASVTENLEATTIDTDAVVIGVLHWLSLPSNKHWLLIIDNVDQEFCTTGENPQAYNVNEYIPKADHGSVLITSRLAGMARTFGADLRVDRVSDEQAKAILDSNSGRFLEGKRKGGLIVLR